MLDSIYHYFSESALWVLGMSGFLSATLLPGASEVTLVATLNMKQYATISIVLVATIGNTFGGLTNYWLGFLVSKRTSSQKYGHKAIVWLRQYGYISLLFSWLPVIGDSLCLAAGWLKMKFWPCVILISIGKAVRYSLLSAFVLGFF